MLALIAMANVMIYLYDRPYGVLQHIVMTDVVDRVVTSVIVVIVDARAFPLFAALFGYGLVQLSRRLARRGYDPADVRRRLRRRWLVLLVIGLAHGALAFSGDILGWYGILGLVMTSLLTVSDRVLLWLAAGSLPVLSFIQGLTYADGHVQLERSTFWSFAVDDPVYAAGLRLLEWSMTPVGLVAVIPAMLVGMWAARRGVLESPGQHRSLLRRTAVIGVAAGVVGGLGLALPIAWGQQSSGPAFVLLSWAHVFTGVMCGLGYLALIALVAGWLERVHADWAMPRSVTSLSALGQRSMSGYLAQTVVFAALLPAWSLGWGATLGTAGAAALGLIVWLFTVVVATWAAHRGRRGPAEVVLRRFAQPSPRRSAGYATIGR